MTMLASLDRAPSARIFESLIFERTYRVPHRITTILMTRFLLELQAANSRDLNLNHDDWIFSSRQIDDDIGPESNGGGLIFAIVGNSTTDSAFGASIGHALDSTTHHANEERYEEHPVEEERGLRTPSSHPTDAA